MLSVRTSHADPVLLQHASPGSNLHLSRSYVRQRRRPRTAHVRGLPHRHSGVGGAYLGHGAPPSVRSRRPASASAVRLASAAGAAPGDPSSMRPPVPSSEAIAVGSRATLKPRPRPKSALAGSPHSQRRAAPATRRGVVPSRRPASAAASRRVKPPRHGKQPSDSDDGRGQEPASSGWQQHAVGSVAWARRHRLRSAPPAQSQGTDGVGGFVTGKPPGAVDPAAEFAWQSEVAHRRSKSSLRLARPHSAAPTNITSPGQGSVPAPWSVAGGSEGRGWGRGITLGLPGQDSALRALSQGGSSRSIQDGRSHQRARPRSAVEMSGADSTRGSYRPTSR